MKNDNLLEVLKDIGLSEKEAEVYLAAMSLGPSTVQKIAQTANVKRTTVYSVIDTLKNKGMVSEEIKGFKTLFVAQDPVKLEGVLDMRMDRLRQALPSLSAAYNLKGDGGYIKYYEGKEAVKSVYLDILNEIQPHEDYCVMANLDDWWGLGKDFLLKFLEKRAEKARIHGINIRMLFQDTAGAREHQKSANLYHSKIKILPPQTKLGTNLVIIPRKVLVNQLTPPIAGIVIENPSVIQMHKEMFEIIWNSVKE